MKRNIVYFLFAGLLGTIGDIVHVLTGTTAYARAFERLPLLPVPAWTPVLFGFSGLLMVKGAEYFSSVCTSRHHRELSVTKNKALACAIAFAGTYALSGVLSEKTSSPTVDILLECVVVATWLVFDGEMRGLLISLLVAFCGTLTEIVLVHNGIFMYGAHVHKILGVASWLPWLYFSAGICARQLAHVRNTEAPQPATEVIEWSEPRRKKYILARTLLSN